MMKCGFFVFFSFVAVVTFSYRSAEGTIEVLSQSVSTSITATANGVSSSGIGYAKATSAPNGGIPGIVDAWGTISFENQMGSFSPWQMYYPPCNLLSLYLHSSEYMSINRDSSFTGFDIATVTATAYSSTTFQVTDPVSVHLLSSYDLTGAEPPNGLASVDFGFGGKLEGPETLMITDFVSDRDVTLPVGIYTLSSWLKAHAEQVDIANYPDNDLLNLFDANFSVGISPPDGTVVTVIPEPATFVIWLQLGGIGLVFGFWRKRQAIRDIVHNRFSA